jgi:nucleoid-associated protein YgaU
LLSDVLGPAATPTVGPVVEGDPSDSIGADKVAEGGAAPAASASEGPKPAGPATRGPLPLVGRTPRPVPVTPPPGVRTHRIGKGDTLAILAEIYYGEQDYADYLVRVNPGLDPRRLVVGQEIIVPEKPGDLSVLRRMARPQPTPAEKPAATPAAGGRTYTVQPGDSFWKVAASELGDGNRWREVYELNKDQVSSPDSLKVGQELQLPEK